jgi:hypothetical protein
MSCRQGWGSKGYGPPYALIAGAFDSQGEGPPLEGNPSLVRGDVAMVPGSMTFVIALAEHPEWGNSHTLWGKVGGGASATSMHAHARMQCVHACCMHVCMRMHARVHVHGRALVMLRSRTGGPLGTCPAHAGGASS